MSTYAFLDVVAALSGPGGSINLASGAGAAEEGITIAAVADTNTMTIGAGGDGMHSLSADTSSLVTVRLLKTSPINALLQAMYNYQKLSSANWGRNTITVRDSARGDFVNLTKVAFKKVPDLNYAKEGGTNEWTFDAISTKTILGTGTPER